MPTTHASNQARPMASTRSALLHALPYTLLAFTLLPSVALGEEAAAAKAATPAAAAPAAATMPASSEVAKAVDGLGASCAKVVELRERLQALADKRKASLAAISGARAEATKQLRTAKVAQLKTQREMKKPGGEVGPSLAQARAAHEAAVAQNAVIARESQALRSAEDEASALATTTAESTTACSVAEAQLRQAAATARKVLADARRESVKARVLAGVQAPAALEAKRARAEREMAALQKSTDEAKGAIAALGAVAPPPAAGGAPGQSAATHVQAMKEAGDKPNAKAASAPGQHKPSASDATKPGMASAPGQAAK